MEHCETAPRYARKQPIRVAVDLLKDRPKLTGKVMNTDLAPTQG
ncbi:hypothetical protein [Streptomyces montanus]|nr:hypothetical protein [Streptomyces montanus]